MAESNFVPSDQLFDKKPDPTFIPQDEVFKEPPPKPKFTEKAPESVTEGANQQAIHYSNIYAAARQHTSPHLDLHAPNILGDAYQKDDGKWYYSQNDKDEKPVMQKDHVVLQDTNDGTWHAFKRTPETDEHPLVGLGRMAMEAMGTGAVPRGAKPLTAAQEAVAASDRLKEATGVQVTLPKAATTDSTVIRGAERTATHLPGGSGPAVAAAERTHGELAAASDKLAEKAQSIPATPAIAGETAKADIGAHISPQGPLADKVNKAYDTVDKFIPGDPAHELKNTLGVASDIQKAVDKTKSAKEFVDPAIEQVLGAITDPKGITYQGLKRLRSQIGALIDSDVNAGISNADLKRLYGGLSTDMRELLEKHGGWKAVSKWERANDLAKATADVKARLQGILGTATSSDEAIFGNIIAKAGSTARADVKILARAKAAMGDTWSEVQSAAIRNMGWTTQGSERAFDANKFLKDYGKLSNEGKNLLFGSDTGLRNALEDFASISQHWDTVKSLGHQSGTLSHLLGAAAFWHSPHIVLPTIAGTNVFSRIMSAPTTAASAAAWARRYEALRLNPNQNNFTAYANAVRTLDNDLHKRVPEAAADLGKKLMDMVHGQ